MDFDTTQTVFGCWKVVSRIGEGSYATVYKIERAEDNPFIKEGKRQQAALKVIIIPHSETEEKQLRSSGMDDASITRYYEDYAGKIYREIEAMVNLRGHSNIVSYEDHQIIKRENGIGWVILIRMELLCSLMDYVQNHKMDMEEVVHMGIELCRALEACEGLHMIHRDIKPDNIFISELGLFKLGDFGIARTASATTNGTVAGTYTYMAPEVFQNRKYNATVDIYSLGMVLYQYLNEGRLPFMPPAGQLVKFGDAENAFNRRMRGEKIPFLDTVTARLNEVICKACSYQPAERYQTAKEMREALEACLSYGSKTLFETEHGERIMQTDSDDDSKMKTENRSDSGFGNQSDENDETVYDGRFSENIEFDTSEETVYAEECADSKEFKAQGNNSWDNDVQKANCDSTNQEHMYHEEERDSYYNTRFNLDLESDSSVDKNKNVKKKNDGKWTGRRGVICLLVGLIIIVIIGFVINNGVLGEKTPGSNLAADSEIKEQTVETKEETAHVEQETIMKTRTVDLQVSVEDNLNIESIGELPKPEYINNVLFIGGSRIDVCELNDKGNKVKTVTLYVYDDRIWFGVFRKYEYEYDDSENIVNRICYKMNALGEEDISLDKYFYDSNGLLEQITEYDSNQSVFGTSKYEHDEEGNCIKILHYDSNGDLTQWWEPECDSQGRFISEDCYKRNCLSDEDKFELDTSFSFIYATVDLPIPVLQNNVVDRFYLCDEIGNPAGWVDWEYDSNRYLVNISICDNDGTVIGGNHYEYNLKADGMEQLIYSRNDNNLMYENEYDNQGNLLEYKYYNNDGSIARWIEYEYDSQGNKIRTTFYNSDGSISSEI